MTETDQGISVEKKYDKIGGLLILVAIGMVLAPIRILLMTVKNLFPAFSKQIWSLLTTPGARAYHPLWKPLLIGELVGNILFLGFSVLIAVFFFQRRRSVPKLAVTFLLANLLFVVIDYYAVGLIPVAATADVGTKQEIIRTLIVCLIWVPYWLVSKRVKGTFVR